MVQIPHGIELRLQPAASYRIVFRDPVGSSPVRSISFFGRDGEEAFLLARQQGGSAELWIEKGRYCRLLQTIGQLAGHGSCGGARVELKLEAFEQLARKMAPE